MREIVVDGGFRILARLGPEGDERPGERWWLALLRWYECSLAAAGSVGDEAAELMRTLATAFGLEQVQQHGLAFTVGGVLDPEQARQAEEQLAWAYRDITARLPELVNAFGITSATLDAPIGKDDYVAAWMDLLGWGDLVPATSGDRQGATALGVLEELRVAHHRTSHAERPCVSLRISCNLW
ncbi:acyl-CoA dehydrogenase [Haloechinothrix sp. LS1_15]|uniref:acyl-CoA dehydrogenase n=1 Tax=Haloechinothrix sp. LS1_15 TaxID=2652248 RepID=UPI002945F0BD|nr:acyl-CoA dehydrogenase [Haloechinothrix sp. LS1_15]MDV6012194.1 hypothetical protein [Haloechinothrix sp. LS1_15]